MLDFVPFNLFIVLVIAGWIGTQSVLPLNASLAAAQAQGNQRGAEQQSALVDWAFYTLIYLGVLTVALCIGFHVLQSGVATGAPLIEAWLEGTQSEISLKELVLPLLSGLALGAVFAPLAKIRPKGQRFDFYSISLWQRLVAGLLHGGIVEEILFRWGLMLLLVFGLAKLTGHEPSNIEFWIANTIAALAFGLAHLPGSATAAPLTWRMTCLVLGSNTIAGLIYGYFFWFQGIEMAMIAHMATHLSLQPLASFLIRPDPGSSSTKLKG